MSTVRASFSIVSQMTDVSQRKKNSMRLLLTVTYIESSKDCCPRDPPQRKSRYEIY